MQYRAQHPSRSGDLQYLGERYPDYLRASFGDTEYGYFADVAALEWAYQMALTAAEQAPVDLGKLRKVAPEHYERLLFVPRPAVGIVESQYPIFAIWQANRPSTAESDVEIRLDSGPSRVLLIRRADHVELREVSAGTCGLMRQFQRGATLGEAAISLAAEIPDFDLDACLKNVMILEAIGGIELSSERSIELDQ